MGGPTRDDLAVNVRGVLLTAFLPIATLAKIYRCSDEEADKIKGRAYAHVCFLNAEISRAKH